MYKANNKKKLGSRNIKFIRIERERNRPIVTVFLTLIVNRISDELILFSFHSI